MTRLRQIRGRHVLIVAVVALLCTAPTPGDIGGCGQSAVLLDAPIFFATKKRIDCERCQGCGLVSTTCIDACDPEKESAVAFPEDCFPLVHDGEVCLRALLVASCSSYRNFTDDSSPRTPSECNFCPPRTE